MKKFICFILLTTLLLSFCGCGEETVSSTVSSVSNTPLPEGAGNYKVDDFKYQVQEDGTVFVKYVGKDSEVVFPDEINGYKVTGIQTMSCWKNETLRKVTIPSSVKTIEVDAFLQCSNLVTVILNEGLTTIEDNVFKDCLKLSNISLPHTLKTIKHKAFYNCTSLTHINIPKNTSIDAEAFSASGLETIDFQEGIETIGKLAFINTKIKSITFPSSLKTIEAEAFQLNSNLEIVNLNEGLIEIGDSAFAICDKLTQITVPKSVQTVTDTFISNSNHSISINFEGDAPTNYIVSEHNKNSYTVYYHKGAKGFTSPTWNGYKTEIW